MEISNRLKSLAEEVDYKSIVVDVGTDHAYLPIYLYKKNKITKAIAVDINEGPLQKANENISKYNLQNFIETRLSDGLKEIESGEIDTVIIAGMGGMLISKILKDKLNLLDKCKKLILQPQLDSDEVRKTLHYLNFKIIKEKMIKEEGKYYNIIVGVKGNEIYSKKADYKYGKKLIDCKDTVLKEYLYIQIGKTMEIIQHLKQKNSENATRTLTQKNALLKIMEEVYSCL